MVDPFIPLSRHVALRPALRISRVLRPSCLSLVLFHAAALWLFCSGRSAVRGCADVDLRHAGLSGARGDSQHPAALATEFLPWRPGAIGIAWPGIAEGFAALGGRLR